jgi:hypothetical protein
MWLADNNASLSRDGNALTITFDGDAAHTFEIPDTSMSSNEFWAQCLIHSASEVYDFLTPPPEPPSNYEGPLDETFLSKLTSVEPHVLAKIVPPKVLTQALMKNRSPESFATLPSRFGVKPNRFQLLGTR